MEYINNSTKELTSHAELVKRLNASIPQGQKAGAWWPVYPAEAPEPESGEIVEAAEPVKVDGKWQYGWTVRAKTSAELQQDAMAIQARLTGALNDHLNAVATQRSYDDRFTCSLRAGYQGPFQEEGKAFAAWMDECNMTAYQMMAEVKAGNRSVPTEAELIAALPVIEWPASPIPAGA